MPRIFSYNLHLFIQFAVYQIQKSHPIMYYQCVSPKINGIQHSWSLQTESIILLHNVGISLDKASFYIILCKTFTTFNIEPNLMQYVILHDYIVLSICNDASKAISKFCICCSLNEDIRCTVTVLALYILHPCNTLS